MEGSTTPRAPYVSTTSRVYSPKAIPQVHAAPRPHEIGVARGAAVDPQLRQGSAAVLTHGVDHIEDLEGDGLVRRLDEFRPARRARHAEHASLGFRTPMRRAQPGECGNEVHAALGIGGVTQIRDLFGVGDELKIVAQPCLDRAGVRHIALEHVFGNAAHAPRQRARQAVGAGHERRPHVHHHRGPCAERRLRHAALEATLGEERGMRIAQHAVNGDGSG